MSCFHRAYIRDDTDRISFWIHLLILSYQRTRIDDEVKLNFYVQCYYSLAGLNTILSHSSLSRESLNVLLICKMLSSLLASSFKWWNLVQVWDVLGSRMWLKVENPHCLNCCPPNDVGSYSPEAFRIHHLLHASCYAGFIDYQPRALICMSWVCSTLPAQNQFGGKGPKACIRYLMWYCQLRITQRQVTQCSTGTKTGTLELAFVGQLDPKWVSCSELCERGCASCRWYSSLPSNLSSMECELWMLSLALHLIQRFNCLY